MARKTNIQNAFSPAVARTTPLGSAGYDNARENVDPHVKTKVINLKEFVQNGISYDFATYLANHPHQNVKTTASPSFVDGYFSGNVGIGTATPDKALHVVGQVKVKSTGTSFGQGGFYFEQSANTSRWEILPAYGTLYWGYNGATEMQLTASGLTVPSGFMTADVVNGTRIRSGQLQMVTNNLHERTTNGVGTLNLNMIGYGEGTTQFRNTKIGNGKSTQIALFEGSSQKLILEGDLEMTGNSIINSDGILSLTSDSYISLDGGVNKHLYFNGDNNFLWRDSGDSYATRMTLVSSTGNLGIGTTTPSSKLHVDGDVESPKIKLTKEGAYCIKLTNKTGANSVQGEVVRTDTANDDAVILAITAETNPIGVFLDTGIADGAEAWIAISGIADVLADNAGFTRGDRIITSITAATIARGTTNNAPAIAVHFQEIGHALETAAANTLGRCVLHFL